MNILRHALVALTPFVFGLLLGLAVVPGDSTAAPQAGQAATSLDSGRI